MELLHVNEMVGAHQQPVMSSEEARYRARRPTPGVDLQEEYTEWLVRKVDALTAELAALHVRLIPVVEHSAVGIYVIQDERYAYVNPRMGDILGTSSEELASRSIYDFIALEDRALLRVNFMDRIFGGICHLPYELRMLHQSGSARHLEVHGRLAQYYGREAIVGTMQDITERKLAQEEQRALQGQFQRLLEHSPVVSYSMTVEGERVIPRIVSENITRVLGFTAEESSSLDWWASRLHPEDSARALASVQETLERESHAVEYRMRHKNGEYVWLEDSRRTVRCAEGLPKEIFGVWVNITGRKEAIQPAPPPTFNSLCDNARQTPLSLIQLKPCLP